MCLHKLQVQELYQEIAEERYKGINIDQKVKNFPIECFTLSRRGYASEEFAGLNLRTTIKLNNMSTK